MRTWLLIDPALIGLDSLERLRKLPDTFPDPGTGCLAVPFPLLIEDALRAAGRLGVPIEAIRAAR